MWNSGSSKQAWDAGYPPGVRDLTNNIHVIQLYSVVKGSEDIGKIPLAALVKKGKGGLSNQAVLFIACVILSKIRELSVPQFLPLQKDQKLLGWLGKKTGLISTCDVLSKQ